MHPRDSTRTAAQKQGFSAASLESLEELSNLSPLPIVLTPRARSILDRLNAGERPDDAVVSMHLERVCVPEAVDRILGTRVPSLRLSEGYFACRIYSVEEDPSTPLLTLILQDEPGIAFPEEPRAGADHFSATFAEWVSTALGIKDVPANWVISRSLDRQMQVITAPRWVLEEVLETVRFPSTRLYGGRAWPLLRCLRAWPLPQPAPAPYSDVEAKHGVSEQMRTQNRRMHEFLSDRLGVVALLRSELKKVEARAVCRFIPRLQLGEGSPGVLSRLALWYDDGVYRFLLFDSEPERDRWANGEGCCECPIDTEPQGQSARTRVANQAGEGRRE